MATIEISKVNSEVTLDCGNASINSLITESYYTTILQHAYCYIVSYKDRVVGTYMLKFTKIELNICPEDIADYRSEICTDCFSVHIKYIAVDKSYQGKGIGTFIMQYIIKSVMQLCEKWPVRLITLDALKEKYKWYLELGFLPFNEKDIDDDSATISMYMDCLLNQDEVNTYCERKCQI